MKRKDFIKKVAVTTGGMILTKGLLAKKHPKDKVFGQNKMTYKLDTAWAKTSAAQFPVNDCHEMVQDSKGRIILLTNETKK